MMSAYDKATEGFVEAGAVMTLWRPGSNDDPDWTWEDELAHIKTIDDRWLDFDRKMRNKRFWFGPPAVLGNDGRVWDGHHRILAAHKSDVLVFASIPWIRSR